MSRNVVIYQSIVRQFYNMIGFTHGVPGYRKSSNIQLIILITISELGKKLMQGYATLLIVYQWVKYTSTVKLTTKLSFLKSVVISYNMMKQLCFEFIIRVYQWVMSKKCFSFSLVWIICINTVVKNQRFKLIHVF